MTGRYPDGDFYGFEKDLPAEELEILHKVREWTHEKVRPIATDYWNRSEFPMNYSLDSRPRHHQPRTPPRPLPPISWARHGRNPSR